MGLFDKKFCDICGDKVNLLTQKKLSDGQLCSDCKQKLGSFTSGWKQRTVQDVKAHLELREQNKQKYQQFNCTAAAGGRNSTLQADFNHRWFIFAVDNRDFRSGNPQLFEFSQLQDFWIIQVMQLCRQIKQDGASVNQGYSQMNQSYGQPQQHPLRFKTTPIIMLHPLHRKQLTLPGFAHPAPHVTKANSVKAAAVQSLQQCLHAARAADGLRQTVSLCRNSAQNAEHACNLKRADCIKK